jgi:hypothetical protein
MKCAVCHTEAAGKFCPKCGSPLEGAQCAVCQAPLLPGARFCTQCGAAVRERPLRLPWVVAGVAIAGIIFVLLLPGIRNAVTARFAGGPPQPAAEPTGANPPPLSGTPREQADRLFNRIMQEREAGNDQQVAFFLPMGITAYRQAGPLDADGLYHLSLLEAAAGQNDAALATADQILAQNPSHLLGLAAAASAAAQRGDSATARGYHQRFLQHFETEQAKTLPEYRDHAQVLPEYRRSAEAFLGRSGADSTRIRS